MTTLRVTKEQSFPAIFDVGCGAFINRLLDTSVKGIVEGLDLKRPIYSHTTAYGHFGKPNLPWEQIIK
jgi:S-adenosylmethionine synthetase